MAWSTGSWNVERRTLSIQIYLSGSLMDQPAIESKSGDSVLLSVWTKSPEHRTGPVVDGLSILICSTKMFTTIRFQPSDDTPRSAISSSSSVLLPGLYGGGLTRYGWCPRYVAAQTSTVNRAKAMSIHPPAWLGRANAIAAIDDVIHGPELTIAGAKVRKISFSGMGPHGQAVPFEGSIQLLLCSPVLLRSAQTAYQSRRELASAPICQYKPDFPLISSPCPLGGRCRAVLSPSLPQPPPQLSSWAPQP